MSSLVDILGTARDVLQIEARAISLAAARLGAPFVQAVETVSACQGRIVVTGLGKSGHIARKIAATLSSTGSPAYFLHPSEALHGDLGLIRDNDVVLAIAFGGETFEVLEVVRFAKRQSLPILAITGHLGSTLAKLADIVLDGTIPKEACPLSLAPTTSTTLTLALGDALAMSVMAAKGFGAEDFANIHPGGSLGRKLYRVHQKMRKIEQTPFLPKEASYLEFVKALNQGGIGHLAIVEPQNMTLLGCITDGDLRRHLLSCKDFNQLPQLKAAELMQKQPKFVYDDEVLANALNLMEQKRINGLFVLSRSAESLCGFLHLHDLIAQKIV